MSILRNMFAPLRHHWLSACLLWAALPAWGQIGTLADGLIDARTLLTRAEGGDSRAAFLLGLRFASTRDGGGRDDSEAVRWFRRASQAGLAEAQYNLGIMYANGRGVEKDLAQAARWYRLASAQGLAEARFNLATLHIAGVGVEQDMTTAAALLHQAADARLPRAQYNLGVLYEHGHGVKLNGRAALTWYQRAANQGYGPAKERLAALLKKLHLNEIPKPGPLGQRDGSAGASDTGNHSPATVTP